MILSDVSILLMNATPFSSKDAMKWISTMPSDRPGANPVDFRLFYQQFASD
jgi:hypothetical protein